MSVSFTRSCPPTSRGLAGTYVWQQGCFPPASLTRERPAGQHGSGNPWSSASCHTAGPSLRASPACPPDRPCVLWRVHACVSREELGPSFTPSSRSLATQGARVRKRTLIRDKRDVGNIRVRGGNDGVTGKHATRAAVGLLHMEFISLRWMRVCAQHCPRGSTAELSHAGNTHARGWEVNQGNVQRGARGLACEMPHVRARRGVTCGGRHAGTQLAGHAGSHAGQQAHAEEI
ncbi:hypothetical protein NN561_019933 [Cricetulus griseus]